jgi:NADH-quinone oxidoreductase subunit C
MSERTSAAEFIAGVASKFPDISVKVHSSRRVYILIGRDRAFELAQFLYREKGCRLSIATGIDTREGFEILYHFSHDPTGVYYTIKTVVPKDDPKIRSLAVFLPAADWIEREMRELLGIEFEGHPNPAPLLTPEDWPQESYPLRRDFEVGDGRANGD